jgi:hypothetical protein
VLKPEQRNIPSIQSFVTVANSRNPALNIGGWLYVDDTLTNVEQVLEGPRSSVERLFYGRRVCDKDGNDKGKEFWVGGIYGDPAHTLKKAFQISVTGVEHEQRVYEHWGMSWATMKPVDESRGGASRRAAKIDAKLPVYGKWLGTGNDEDLEEDCDGEDERDMGWVGKGERKKPEEGDVVENDDEEGEKELGGRRKRGGNI